VGPEDGRDSAARCRRPSGSAPSRPGAAPEHDDGAEGAADAPPDPEVDQQMSAMGRRSPMTVNAHVSPGLRS
jgi:hypothetical protein